jgi:DNA-binding NarL/FixJ family response regulator
LVFQSRTGQGEPSQGCGDAEEKTLVRVRRGTQVGFPKLNLEERTTMNTGARRSFAANSWSSGNFVVTDQTRGKQGEAAAEMTAKSASSPERIRVLVSAENRLLREALTHMLSKKSRVEVRGLEWNAAEASRVSPDWQADILLMSSQGNLTEDLQRIPSARAQAPKLRILLLGIGGDEKEFLQYVRAGVNGYLPQDASGEEVVNAILALWAGEAVCRGNHCGALFRYFKQEASTLPNAAVRHQLGLTRREQQLIPLIAQGLTNKEIANHFSLSEQTIKNHVHRMKVKIGAGDRFDIVQVYRMLGFLV